MLAGPDLLVVLAIAVIVVGPKKLPELAKTLGKALGEFKKTTEDIKENIGIKELEGIRSGLTGIDLFTNLAEKVSHSMTSTEGAKDSPSHVDVSSHEAIPFPQEACADIERLEQEKNEELKRDIAGKTQFQG